MCRTEKRERLLYDSRVYWKRCALWHLCDFARRSCRKVELKYNQWIKIASLSNMVGKLAVWLKHVWLNVYSCPPAQINYAFIFLSQFWRYGRNILLEYNLSFGNDYFFLWFIIILGDIIYDVLYNKYHIISL